MSGFRVVQASDGFSALEKAFALRPDAIVMDLSLPLLDGWSAIGQLKNDERTETIPIVAMSGHSNDLHRRQGDPKVARWDAYLTKPCLPDELVAQIQRLLLQR
jgi:CheY-like chemotaxis protein